ncbi:GAF domain-containing protein [Rhodococcus sp. O3]|uniref:GAF domain-containing protein n=1 Tax=Rhodococcus sp. O3 TaxID=3404919 RepID=UPI003B683B36
MANPWLLISAFGGAEPTLIGQGNQPKSFIPLDRVFRSRHTASTAMLEVQQLVLDMINRPSPIDHTATSGSRMVAMPLLNSERRLHGLHLWRGRVDETPPDRDPVGAWHFNLTLGQASGSDDLFDLYRVAEEDRRSTVAQAGAFTRLKTNLDEGEALAKILRSEPGTEHQAVWTVVRDDGEERAAHFSCRMLREGEHVILRGLTHDIGPAASARVAAQAPVVLEHRIVETKLRPGEHLAYVDLRRLQLVKWRGEPMPGIAWENLPGQPTPGIHPDDVSIARRMVDDLAHRSTSGEIRFRALDGTWRLVHLEVSLMMFDQHTTGGLVTARFAE